MALQEIDDAEIKRYKEYETVLNTLGSNPKTRPGLLRLFKELNPNAAIPELDAAAPVIEQMKGLEKKLAEMEEAKKKAADEEAETKSKKEVESWREEGHKHLKSLGYEDEGIKKIEELMEKRRLADYEAAESLYVKLNPPEEMASPVDFGNKRWQNFDKPSDTDERRKMLMSGEQGARAWQAQELNEAFREMRAAKQRVGRR